MVIAKYQVAVSGSSTGEDPVPCAQKRLSELSVKHPDSPEEGTRIFARLHPYPWWPGVVCPLALCRAIDLPRLVETWRQGAAVVHPAAAFPELLRGMGMVLVQSKHACARASGHILVMFYGDQDLAWVSLDNIRPWELCDEDFNSVLTKIRASAERKDRQGYPPIPILQCYPAPSQPAPLGSACSEMSPHEV